MKKIAGVSRCDRNFDRYIEWLEEGKIEYMILDYHRNNFDDVKKCSSLLLTGGDDIFPEFYNDFDEGKDKGEYVPERDGFEFRLLDYALMQKIPIFGICRGMQLINCRLNGNLIDDIETIRGVNHRKIDDKHDREHEVIVFEDTLLKVIIGSSSGTINSSHHQGIDRLGEGLMISAKSPDGIIEGLEWGDKKNKGFLLAIQWHPERMNDKASVFTKNVLERFKEETEKD